MKLEEAFPNAKLIGYQYSKNTDWAVYDTGHNPSYDSFYTDGSWLNYNFGHISIGMLKQLSSIDNIMSNGNILVNVNMNSNMMRLHIPNTEIKRL